MNIWRELDAGKNAPLVTNVIITTPKDSLNVYEYDGTRDVFVLHHTVSSTNRPPGDLAFVPQSYNEGGTPLDVVLITRSPNTQRALVRCRPIGLLRMDVERVRDDKIVAIPTADGTLDEVMDVNDLEPRVRDDVRKFFESLLREQHKATSIEGWYGFEEARQAVQRALNLHKRRFTNMVV